MSDPSNNERAARDRLLTLLINVACPALIVCAVTSVAWFLIDIVYVGPHEDRCKYILGLFCFAAVFVSRISIQLGQERALAYGFLLALIAFLVVSRFMQGNVIVVGLVLAFVLWCASRLVWDCTFIDQTRDASGQGLFDRLMAKIRARKESTETRESDEGLCEDDDPDSEETSDGFLSRMPGASISALLFSRRQANTPGTWVFVFLLAGLPFFGLGQIFISVWDEQRQSNVLAHAVIYYASLLGLLMLTSVYGMQRYLESKQSHLPNHVARKWLMVGGGVALAIVIAAIFLPRPTPEYSLSRLATVLTSEGDDNADAMAGGEGTKQENGARNTKSNDNAKQEGDAGGGEDESGNDDASASEKTQQNKRASGKEPRDSETSNPDSDSSGEQHESASKGDRRGQSERDQSRRSAEADSPEDQAKDDLDNASSPPRESSTEAKKPANANRKRPPNRSDNSPEEKEQPSQVESRPWVGAWATTLLRIIILAAAAIAVIWVLLRHGKIFRGLLGSFLNELRRFWDSLFASRRMRESAGTQTESTTTPQVYPRSFGDFSNPFESGLWQTWSPQKLIRYTLDALEAWGRDSGVSRSPDDTVLEFSRQLARAQPVMRSELAGFTQLYNDITYGGSDPTNDSIARIRSLWQRLDSNAPAQPRTANA